ncbi:hypothetical protein [Paraburkholderia sp. MM6662-R1]|uniref:hypothetical protein n=1 Tax=Paraburkholderia sp. MM6662-R1 TaxID=2991066 RepID=UPI003D1F606F
MANETSADTPAPAPAAAAAKAATPHEMTLERFAIELSQRDKRVGLVNGFVFVEKQARHFKDVESAFQARYDAFIKSPV